VVNVGVALGGESGARGDRLMKKPKLINLFRSTCVSFIYTSHSYQDTMSSVASAKPSPKVAHSASLKVEEEVSDYESCAEAKVLMTSSASTRLIMPTRSIRLYTLCVSP
jgi:hypothetical protein